MCKHLLYLLSISFFVLCHVNLANSETFNLTIVDKSPIKIGSSLDLSGAVKLSGISEKQGAELYFNKVNANGGIQGRKLQLITLDDKYEPLRAAENVRRLMEQDQVLAFIGNIGSSTAAVVVPILRAQKVMLFAPIAGSNVVYPTPTNRYIFNLRIGYAEENATLLKGILSIHIKPDEIAFFTQNDAFGDSVYKSITTELKKLGYLNADTLPYGRYSRNTVNVEAALAQIIQEAKKPPKVFFMGGNFAANAKFVKLAAKEWPNAIFLTLANQILTKDLSQYEDGKVIILQRLPRWDSNVPAAREYRDDFKKYAKTSTTPRLEREIFEGYLGAKVLVMAIQKAAAQHNLTREGIIDALESMHNVDIGIGTNIHLDKDHHQALHLAIPIILKNGHFIPFEWNDLKTKFQ